MKINMQHYYSSNVAYLQTNARRNEFSNLFDTKLDKTEKQEDKQDNLTSDDSDNAEESSETKSQILVTPDGTRILVLTMIMAGMQTTTSLKLSKPTQLPNSIPKEDGQNLEDTTTENLCSFLGIEND
ncbi:hypothetical protein [Anaerosporobacter sp.]|uniref:hypothetical protein n=1 Tax=Anaerosporobacter sp. TaxID=1872529 RepID=UPI00286EB69D|nr:hypothetical protein [Anaerosporobacter sp.]